MKKNRFIKVLVFLFAVALLGSATVIQTKAMTSKKQITTNNVVAQDDKEDEARAAVDALFTDNKHTALNPDITQTDIDKASELVNDLPDGLVKEDLKVLIVLAQNWFNTENARKLVYGLYSDKEHTTIRIDLTQADIDEARTLVDQLMEGTVKDELNILLTRAQYLFGVQEARKVVYGLFRDSKHRYIREGLTLNDVYYANKIVETTPIEGPVRAEFRVLVIIAEQQVRVTEVVYALFTDDTRTAIKEDITQANIDKAQMVIDSTFPDEWAIKKDLSTLVSRAQDLFNQREAQRIVYALYKDGENTVIRDNLTQAEVDNARAVVEALPPGPLQIKLRVLVIVAQHQLDEKMPQLIVQPAI